MAIGKFGRAAVLATLLASAAVGIAWATEGWYARVDAGYSVDGALKVSGGDLDFDNDWSGHAGLGYAFQNGFRLEGEGAYRQNDLSDIAGDVNATAAMANLYYDFNRDGAIQPYVGVGVGVAKIDVNGAAAGLVSFDDNDTVAAYQGMAGVAIPLSERLDLDVGYRYFKAPEGSFNGRVSDGEGGFRPFTFDGDYEHQAVLVGLRYQFGARAAPVAAAPPPPPAPLPAPPQVAPLPAPVACAATDFTVYFEWDRHNLNEAAIETIETAVERARACTVSAVMLIGHTDTSGPNRYNQGLSERRSAVVRDALVARGIVGDLISAQSKGETDLAHATADGVRDPLNRRTAVTISFR